MKIQEFRDKMKSADRAALEKIAADLYRRLPKALKEEELDQNIELILKGSDAPKPSPKGAIPFDKLEKEIRTFLSNVDAKYYFEPNRVVPKAQRSKWRFEVMRFLKQLDSIPSDDAHAETAAKLYLEIYNRLAFGCGYYIFPSEDPFASILRNQSEFYSTMVARYFSTGFTDAKILDMLRAATSTYIDRYSIYLDFETVFVRELRTRDMREKALIIAKDEVKRIEAEELKKTKRTWQSGEYHVREKINEICIVILGLGIATYDEAASLDFFMKHCLEPSQEIKLYIALHSIDAFGGSPSFWLKVYEGSIRRGIKPRDKLVAEYKERKANG
jgi:hypothetical protein